MTTIQVVGESYKLTATRATYGPKDLDQWLFEVETDHAGSYVTADIPESVVRGVLHFIDDQREAAE